MGEKNAADRGVFRFGNGNQMPRIFIALARVSTDS